MQKETRSVLVGSRKTLFQIHSFGLKLLFLLLVICVEASADDFTYKTNGGTISISAYTGPGGAVVIPATVNGMPVTEIGFGAFFQQSSLTSVTIPESVTNIWDSAFNYCRNLTEISVDPANPSYASIDGVLFNKSFTMLRLFPAGRSGSYTIPNSVTIIGGSAFAASAGLTNVTIPNSVTVIGGSAFSSCSGLSSVVIPNGVTSIEAFTFWLCSSLKSVTIPNSVTNIGMWAFLSCRSLGSIALPNGLGGIGDNAFGSSGLTNVTVPESVNTIGLTAFGSCSHLTNIAVASLNSFYSSADGVLFDKSQATLLCYPAAKVGNYEIPNGVARIEVSAFQSSFYLTNVSLPNTLTNIGRVAFGSCSSLMNVTIPRSVSSMGDGVFAGCKSLPAIEVDPLNTNFTSVDGVLFNFDRSILWEYPSGKAGSYTVPAGVLMIYHLSFVESDGLTEVIIPHSVVNIGRDLFDNCDQLKNIFIGTGVTNIEVFAFIGCTKLSGVYFEGNAPVVDSTAFSFDTNIVYYLPGKTGWGASFAGRPTAIWTPQLMSSDSSFGVRSNQFGFNIRWGSGLSVAVDACTDLSNPTWTALSTNTVVNGVSYFVDSQWANYPSRYYRLRTP